MSHPLVSVVLCTFNGARFLRTQLDSLLAQDYPRFEVVAVDDGSTDESVRVLEEYGRRDTRIQVHRNPVNLGFTKNFENGIGLARGELIAPCDQDDVWLPNKLSTLVSRRGSAELVYCDSELIDEGGESIGLKVSEQLVMYRGDDPRVFAFHNCVSGHALLCTRTLVDRAAPFPPGYYHDWWLAFVAAATSRVEYVDACLVRFRQHRSSFTQQSRDHQRSASRLGTIELQTEWLRRLRDYPGNTRRAFFEELYQLWCDWQHSYFAPGLARFWNQHQDVLCAVLPEGDSRPWSRRSSMFWGLSTLRLVRPARYRR